MKLGKTIVFGIIGVVLGINAAAAQDIVRDKGTISNQQIVEICNKLRETHESVGGEKCEVYRLECEASLTNLITTGIEECRLPFEGIVDCVVPIGGRPICPAAPLDKECIAKVFESAVENYTGQLEQECAPKEETPPAEQPEAPVVQPEQPGAPAGGFQVGDAGQAAPGLGLSLRGSGCTLGAAPGMNGIWIGLWLLLPLLGLRRRK